MENDAITFCDRIKNYVHEALIKKESRAKKRNIAVTPFAFTEHGVTMAATVLKSTKAIKMSVAIIKAFIELKKFFLQHKDLATQLKELRRELYDQLGEHDAQLSAIIKTIEKLLERNSNKTRWEERRKIGFREKS